VAYDDEHKALRVRQARQLLPTYIADVVINEISRSTGGVPELDAHVSRLCDEIGTLALAKGELSPEAQEWLTKDWYKRF
jgi:hypothetical protein